MPRQTYGHVRIPFDRVHLELTNVCDFNCAFCPKSLMTRKYGYMDYDLACRLIDEIAAEGLAEKITFHVMGEPTLHPRFFDILEHARDARQPVGLTTNGGGLGGEVGRRLLDAELAQVDVSLQTPDAESFELRKAGRLTFEEYLDGIVRFFAEYRRRWPRTTFKFRFMNTTIPCRPIEEKQGPIRVISSTAELHEVFAHWVGRVYELTGVNGATLDGALKRLKRLKSWHWNVVEVLPWTYFETYILGNWGNAFTEDEVREAWAGYCPGMRDHFGVMWNGDVVLCCVDYDGETAIGNTAGRSLRDILHSDELGRVMRGFRRLRPTLEHCRKCLGDRSAFTWLVNPFIQLGVLSVMKPFFYRKTRLYEGEGSVTVKE